ncbi:MAG: hypothetical protein ACLTXW_10110 [Christensenellales bacterium]
MFRNRAIFPIIDQYGNVLAFGGRAIENVQPKYLNTSDTPFSTSVWACTQQIFCAKSGTWSVWCWSRGTWTSFR